MAVTAGFVVTFPLASDASSIPVHTAGRFAVVSARGPESLAPGVYTVHGSAGDFMGELIFDPDGEANAQWVFLMSGSFVASQESPVFMLSAVSESGVRNYWKARSLPTLDIDTLADNILPDTSIAMNGDESSGGFTGTADPTLQDVPEVSPVILIGSGLLSLAVVRRRHRRRRPTVRK